MTGGGYPETMWRESCAHRVGSRSLVVLALALAVTLGFRSPDVADAARPPCAEAVLDDWTTGALDSHYEPECYEAALDALPEDLRAYTTAADDITRAAIAASRAANTSGPSLAGAASRRVDPESADDLHSFPPEVAVLGVLLATLCLAGGGAAIMRRRRRA